MLEAHNGEQNRLCLCFSFIYHLMRNKNINQTIAGVLATTSMGWCILKLALSVPLILKHHLAQGDLILL